jgi:hypothetical protein
MESILNFVTKFTDVVRNHIKETNDCIGKEVVDSTATKAGICVDKIKVAYGAKFSMLGHIYKPEDVKNLENFGEDVLVCQGTNGFFFVPVSDVEAFGKLVVLVRSKLGQMESTNMNHRKEEVFNKFVRTRDEIKKVLPTVEETKARKRKGKLNIFY